jgi:hypothetical protein
MSELQDLAPFSVIHVDDVEYHPFVSDEEWLKAGSEVKMLAPRGTPRHTFGAERLA